MNTLQDHLSQPLYGVLLSTILWSSLLLWSLCTSLLDGRTFRFRNLLVAFVHDSIAVLLPVTLVLTQPLHLGGPNTRNQLIVLNTCAGYFFADGVCWIIHGISTNKYDYVQLSHHILCFSGTVACWSTGQSGADLTLGILITHISSPFGYYRFFAKELGLLHTPTAKLCKHVYFWLKAVVVLALCPLLVVSILSNSIHCFLIKVVALGLYFVNLVWLRQVVAHYK